MAGRPRTLAEATAAPLKQALAGPSTPRPTPILKYRWDTLIQSQESMGKVAGTAAFGKVMALVVEPESMRIRCGVPAT